MEFNLGTVTVNATKNEGLSPEHWAERATENIIYYSENLDPVLQVQAKEFKKRIYEVILSNIKNAVQSDRTTLIYTLEKEGHKCGSDIIRRM